MKPIYILSAFERYDFMPEMNEMEGGLNDAIAVYSEMNQDTVNDIIRSASDSGKGIMQFAVIENCKPRIIFEGYADNLKKALFAEFPELEIF